MMKDTPQGQTNYCASCEDLERKLQTATTENECLSSSCKAVTEKLQAAEAKIDTIRAERDALQARIDAAEKQEPHCWLRNGYVCFDAPAIGMEDEYVPLYTHPAIPPEGMMLVPVEPTYQMCAQALVECPVMGLSINAIPTMYKAMLKSVPAKGE
jgi:hypothetical protein